MPSKDYPKTEEQASQVQASQPSPATEPASDMSRLLTTLHQVFSTFGNQLRDEAPKPFTDNAKIAVDVFNDIVAGLKLQSVPRAITIVARVLKPTEVELTWTDDSNNADGYKVKRCHGQYCQELVEIAQLLPNVRSFQDVDLSANATYRYQLVAFNSRGETSSNILNVPTTTANRG